MHFGELLTVFEHLASTSAIYCTQATSIGDWYQVRAVPKLIVKYRQGVDDAAS